MLINEHTIAQTPPSILIDPLMKATSNCDTLNFSRRLGQHGIPPVTQTSERKHDHTLPLERRTAPRLQGVGLGCLIGLGTEIGRSGAALGEVTGEHWLDE